MTDSSRPRRVIVTAAGIISPLGLGLEQTAEALRAGRDSVTEMTAFDVSQTRSHTAGQVQKWPGLSREEARENPARLHPAGRMMIAAAQELQRGDPGFTPEAAVVGTTSGGMTYGETFYRRLLEQDAATGRHRSRAAWLANYSSQKPVLDALRSADWRVPSQIIANACASGTNAIGHALNLIRSGQRQRVVCGGYDALSELVFAGFDALQASTPEKIRPFDRERTGLVLGEGAALLALEEAESAAQRRAPVLAEIVGYGLSTDNYHLTQPHPSGEGPYLAMQRALESAALSSESVEYINAHGTATPFNDATEGAAISRLFPHRPPVSSTKSMMGHSLGAAGAVEAVFCLLALQHDFLPPNINYREPDPQWDLDIVANAARPARIQRVMSNSFGFGGTNASIILQRT